MNRNTLFKAVRAAVSFSNQVIAIGDYYGPVSEANRQSTIAQLEAELARMTDFVIQLKYSAAEGRTVPPK